MIDITKLPLFIPKTTPVFFPEMHQRAFAVDVIADNKGIYLNQLWTQLDINRQRLRYITVQPTYPIFRPTTKYLYTYRKMGLLPVPYDKINTIPHNKNFINDVTYAEQFLLSHYLKNMNSYRGDRAYKLIAPLYKTFPNRTNALIYIIDRNKPFNLSIYRRIIWYLINQLQFEKNRVYDYAFLCILPGPVWIKFLDPRYPVNAIRLITILKGIKPINKAVEIDIASNEIVSSNSIDPKYKNAIKAFLVDHPDIAEKVINQKIPTTRVAVAALEYKISGNKEDANKIISAQTPITTDDLNKTVKKYKELIHTSAIEVQPPIDPVIKRINPSALVDHHTGEQIFEFRTQDYTKNLQNDLANTFKQLETSTFPFKLVSMQFTPHIVPNSVRRNDLVEATIKLKDDTGKIHTIQLYLPQLHDNTFTVNNKPYIIVNQLMILPIFFIKPYQAKLTTSFATITLTDKFPHKKNAYYHVYISGFKLELGPVLAFLMGFENTLKLFGITQYKIEDIKPEGRKQKYVVIGDKFIYINQELTEVQSTLLTSFTRVPHVASQYNIFQKDYWVDVIIERTQSRSSSYIIETVWRRILDVATVDVLKAKHQPTTMPEIILYICERIIDPNNVDERNDLTKQRVRNSEIITQYVMKHLSNAYSGYMTHRQIGDKAAKLLIDPKEVLTDILSDPNIQAMDQANPVEELSAITRVTPTGIGGLPTKEAITIDYRNIHPSYFGNIDPTDTPEGGENVGALQHLTMNASLHSRGIISSKSHTDTIGSGMLSSASALVPYINHNDGARCLFSANQMRSIVTLKNNDIPLVQSGYESILSSYLSDKFIKRSSCDGTVIAVTNSNIIVKCNSGKHVQISIQPVLLRSGQGKHGFGTFKPLVKIGSKVKKNQTLAEGASIKNGLIAPGVNLLTAYAPYRGYNYEDGIVISEDLVTNGKLTSTHYDKVLIQVDPNSKIKFIGNIGDTIQKGFPIISFIPPDVVKYTELIDEDLDDIAMNTVSINMDTTGTIFRIDCYGPPSTPIDYPELREIYERFKQNYCKEHNVNKLPKTWKYGNVNVRGVLLEFHIKYDMPIQVGDKMCNRHGNKGVIGKIIPSDKMPTCVLGKLDMILNPLGVISRMNIGQILELYSGLIAKRLNLTLPTLPYDKGLQLLYNVCTTISGNDANAPMMQLYNGMKRMPASRWKTIMEMIRVGQTLIPILAPPFKEQSVHNIMQTLKLLKLKTRYKIYAPEFGTTLQKPVPVGYMYMNKLEHISEWKLAARSTRTYIPQTMQPPRGKSRQGGQRLGELESWSLFSWGADHVFSELYGALSDDHSTKSEIISEIIEKGDAHFKEPKVKPTRDALFALLSGIHIQPF